MASDPPVAASDALQNRVETLYLRGLALEREVRRLKATHPVVCQMPAAGGPFIRVLRRLVPRVRRRYDRALVAGSGLFDSAWYLARNDDVAKAGVRPLDHFMTSGWAEARDPGPHFCIAHYTTIYPDIAAAGLNPLVHYLRAGWQEGRTIRPGMSEPTTPHTAKDI